MASRSSAQAVNTFIDLLRQALSCVTDGVLDVRGGYHPAELPHIVALNQGMPVRLGGNARLLLLVSLHYRIVEDSASPGSWTVRIVAYYFTLADRDDREILAYHWHPAGRSNVTWPHLHLGSFSHGVGLSRAHLPTGCVSIEQILRLAIADLGVRPRRKDWADVLNRTQAAYEGQ